MIQAALLLTDIVDSTSVTETIGDEAMSSLWGEHDRVSRDLLVEWHGVEVNRSDGFLLRFEKVDDAVGFALDYHGALRHLFIPLKARAGMHLGPVFERLNLPHDSAIGAKSSELAGIAIPMVGRIMALAAAGQTLLSSNARAAIASTALQIESHGHWRLKGIDDVIELFEVGDAFAPFSLPTDGPKAYSVVLHGHHWLPRREVPNSLPAERNRFVGRRAELRELAIRVHEDSRLTSIVGIGGTGKTRLLQHFAWRHLGELPGGAWFCDLSQAATFDELCGAVAQGLQISLGQTDAAEQIGNAIAGRGVCLIALDNFEQVALFAERSLGRWLDQTVDALFVVTTRNVLGLGGEAVVSLSPLLTRDGEELFKIRANAARGNFVVEGDQQRQLSELIALLDGLPLAIELAAARTRVLSLPGILERMRERFNLLTSSHGRPRRQATLMATLDWSWDLLTDWERLALAQLSVFEGGFTLQSLEAVVDCRDSRDRHDAVEILQSLVDKSWVVRIDDRRFALLKSVQQYAALRLVTFEDDHDAADGPRAGERHWKFFGSLDERGACEDRCIEIDNLVVATRRATSAAVGADASACLLSSWWAFRRRGPFQSAIDLGLQIREIEGLTPLDRARIEFVIGNAWRHMGFGEEARTALQTAHALATQARAAREQSWILAAIGDELTQSKQVDLAEHSFQSALALAREVGDRHAESAILNSLGALLQESERAEKSIEPYREALSLARLLRDQHLEGGILGNLGGAFHALGRLDEAAEHYKQAIELSQATGNRRWVGNMRCNLGLLLLEQGELAGAKSELLPALEEARQLGHLRLECTTAWNLGLAFKADGDPDQASSHFRLAYETARQTGDLHAQKELLLLMDSVGPVSEAPFRSASDVVDVKPD